MKHHTSKTLRTVGIIAFAAGVLTYPAILLVRYINKKRAEDRDQELDSEDYGSHGTYENEGGRAFAAYRGTKKKHPHHKKQIKKSLSANGNEDFMPDQTV